MNDPRKPPELFAERPITSDFARSRGGHVGVPYAVRRLITLFIVFAVVGVVMYYALAVWNNRTPSEIPTIKSEGNYKQRPQQPGGIDIPHQDVQVYQSLDKGTPKDQVEHLLPMPETPQVAKPAPMPKEKTVDAAARVENLMSPPNAAPEKIVTTARQDSLPAQVPTVGPDDGVSKDVAEATQPAASSQPVVAQQTTKFVKTTVTPAATSKPAPQTIDDVIKDVTKPTQATEKSTAPSSLSASSTSKSILQLAALPNEICSQ